VWRGPHGAKVPHGHNARGDSKIDWGTKKNGRDTLRDGSEYSLINRLELICRCFISEGGGRTSDRIVADHSRKRHPQKQTRERNEEKRHGFEIPGGVAGGMPREKATGE